MKKIKSGTQYAENWAEGITTLILKDGDDEDPNNYRAMTIVNVLAKIMVILINERLFTFFENERKTIKREQIGFQKICRPANHLFVLNSLATDQGKKLFTCFEDFQKAFDSLWRMGLFYKLLNSGVQQDLVKLIKDMCEKSSQMLKFGIRISQTFMTHIDVKQGCILSPNHFNIFINNIPDMFDSKCGTKNLTA